MQPSLRDMTLVVRVSSEQPLERTNDDDEAYPSWYVSLVGILDGKPGLPDRTEELGGAIAVLCRDARWDRSFWARLDETSQDMEIFGSALSSNSRAADEALFDHTALNGDVLLFDRVWIEPAARGARLSHALVDAAARAISPEAVLAVFPLPPHTQDDISIRLLRRHWERGGFAPYRSGVYIKRQADPFSSN